MSRPRRNEHTREKLLEEGVDLISRFGYHGTGLKMILDAVAVPKGSFYHYFASKEQFAAEIITEYTDGLFARFDDYLAKSAAPPLEKIRVVYAAMIAEFEAQQCERGCLIGDMAAEVASTSDLCRNALQNTLLRWKTRIEPLFSEAIAQGCLRDDIAVSAMCDLFWNAWEGGILRMKIDGHAESLKSTLALLLDEVLAPPK